MSPRPLGERRRRAKALAATASVVTACLLQAAPASAGDDRGEARADYDAAAAAYDRGDYRIAAARFAKADERVPNPRALHLAMAAALRTQEAALGMNLVERASLRAQSTNVDPATLELARKLRARFEASTAALTPLCAADVTCHPSVDGERVDPSRVRWVSPGRHVVSFVAEGDRVVPLSSEVTVHAGERVDVPMTLATATEKAPPDPPLAAPNAVVPAPEPHGRSGLSPAFFWTGVAATGVSLATATAFMVVLGNKHDDFVAAPSRETADAGDAAQTRTRVAFAVTGVLASATAVLAIFTDFKGRDAGARALVPAPRYTLGVAPMGATFAGNFW